MAVVTDAWRPRLQNLLGLSCITRNLDRGSPSTVEHGDRSDDLTRSLIRLSNLLTLSPRATVDPDLQAGGGWWGRDQMTLDMTKAPLVNRPFTILVHALVHASRYIGIFFFDPNEITRRQSRPE